jgi:hypothetical protein
MEIIELTHLLAYDGQPQRRWGARLVFGATVNAESQAGLMSRGQEWIDMASFGECSEGLSWPSGRFALGAGG